MICAGMLSKDTQTNKVLVQLRFQNVDNQHKTIVAVKVAIQAFGIAHNILGDVKEYQYLDLKTERGSEAGSKQPVYLDDNTARSFSVSVLEVVYEDGDVWTGNTQNWCSLQQVKLSDKFSAELTAQYQRDTFAEAKYEPFAKDGIWMCACGTLNVTEDNVCCHCHAKRTTLFAALDQTTLTTNLRDYTEKGNVEKQKKQNKKKIIVALGSILCVIGLALGMFASSINKKEKMLDAFDAYIEYNANNTVWVFFSDGTYRNKIFYGGECIDEEVGKWETVSVSGNTMRIKVGTWGEYDVTFDTDDGQYKVSSFERAH